MQQAHDALERDVASQYTRDVPQVEGYNTQNIQQSLQQQQQQQQSLQSQMQQSMNQQAIQHQIQQSHQPHQDSEQEQQQPSIEAQIHLQSQQKSDQHDDQATSQFQQTASAQHQQSAVSIPHHAPMNEQEYQEYKQALMEQMRQLQVQWMEQQQQQSQNQLQNQDQQPQDVQSASVHKGNAESMQHQQPRMSLSINASMPADFVAWLRKKQAAEDSQPRSTCRTNECLMAEHEKSGLRTTEASIPDSDSLNSRQSAAVTTTTSQIGIVSLISIATSIACLIG
jgi:hypothetical protein